MPVPDIIYEPNDLFCPQMKVTLKKFNDSLNGKINKLQSLLKDLEENFFEKDIEQ